MLTYMLYMDITALLAGYVCTQSPLPLVDRQLHASVLRRLHDEQQANTTTTVPFPVCFVWLGSSRRCFVWLGYGDLPNPSLIVPFPFPMSADRAVIKTTPTAPTAPQPCVSA